MLSEGDVIVAESVLNPYKIEDIYKLLLVVVV